MKKWSFMACSVCFLTELRTTRSRVVPSLYQSAIKQMFFRLAYSLFLWRHFLNEGFLISDDQVVINLASTLLSIYCFSQVFITEANPTNIANELRDISKNQVHVSVPHQILHWEYCSIWSINPISIDSSDITVAFYLSFNFSKPLFSASLASLFLHEFLNCYFSGGHIYNSLMICVSPLALVMNNSLIA